MDCCCCCSIRGSCSRAAAARTAALGTRTGLYQHGELYIGGSKMKSHSEKWKSDWGTWYVVENCGCVPDRPRFGLVLRPGRRRPEAGQGVRHEALAAAAGGGGVVGRRGGLRRRPTGRVVVDGGCLRHGVLVVRRLVSRASPICGHERTACCWCSGPG